MELTALSDILKVDKTKEMDLYQHLKYKTFIGDYREAMFKILHGISPNNQIGVLTAGLANPAGLKPKVFMTRPQLKLDTRNLLQDRKMSVYIRNKTSSDNKIIGSFEDYARLMLDPRLGTIGDYNGDILNSPLVNNHNAFIPLLTNSIEGITGWPDTVAPVKTSTPGVMKEESAMIDGNADFLGKFDLNVTFRRLEGNPVLKLLKLWVRYPSLTFTGVMQPYYDFIRADEYDYNTRIYEFILAKDGETIQEVACTGASFPNTVSDSAVFNVSSVDNPLDEGGDSLTFNFTSIGAIYNDPITLLNFNIVGGIFHPGLRLLNKGSKNHGLSKIPKELWHALSGYPRVDLETMKLEYWIETPKLNTVIKSITGDKGESIVEEAITVGKELSKFF